MTLPPFPPRTFTSVLCQPNMLALILVLFGATHVEMATAQRPSFPPPEQGPRSERMEALRIAFMTEELALTPEESATFWPMQHAFDAKLEALRESLKSHMDATMTGEVDERAAREAVAAMTELRKSMVDLEAAHLLDVMDLLGPKRALRMPMLQREMAQRIREAMQRGGANRPATDRDPGRRPPHGPRR